MWIKICGNTNGDDCLLAAELGADAIGFVFAEGKRTVTAAQVAPITEQLPAFVEKIGVFATRDYHAIVAAVEQAGLSGVQLHSPLDLSLSERLRVYFGNSSEKCSVIQVLPWWTDASAEEQRETFATEAEAVAEDGNADALLIDSRTREASGGTGKTFDWVAAKDALQRVNYRLIVAGGLSPANVAQAIHALQPWGVDVSSGVELSPGHKDPEKLKEFIRQARAAAEPFRK